MPLDPKRLTKGFPLELNSGICFDKIVSLEGAGLQIVVSVSFVFFWGVPTLDPLALAQSKYYVHFLCVLQNRCAFN